MFWSLQINLASNQLCGIDHYGQGTYTDVGIKAIAEAMTSGSLTAADMRFNRFDDNAMKALRECVKDRAGFELRL